MKDFFKGIISIMLLLFVGGVIFSMILSNNISLRKTNQIAERKVQSYSKENNELLVKIEKLSNEKMAAVQQAKETLAQNEELVKGKREAEKKSKNLISEKRRLTSDLKKGEKRMTSLKSTLQNRNRQISDLNSKVQNQYKKIVGLKEESELWKLNLDETVKNENRLIVLNQAKSDSLIMLSDSIFMVANYNMELEQELVYAKVKMAFSYSEFGLGFFLAVFFIVIIRKFQLKNSIKERYNDITSSLSMLINLSKKSLS